MKTWHKGFTLTLLATTLLAGCGGGGGGSGGSGGSDATATAGPATSTVSFPLQSAFNATVANGLTKTFTVSGGCNGSGSKTTAPAAAGTPFEGATGGVSAVSTLSMSLSDCTPASTAQTVTSYFDSNYVPLAAENVGVNYGVYLTPPAMPASVAVNDTGTYGTETLYANSTKATSNGTVVQSYVIEGDTAGTAIVNLISKLYNPAGTLTATEQSRFQIAAVGALTPISTDIQYANGNNLHLILTYN